MTIHDPVYIQWAEEQAAGEDQDATHEPQPESADAPAEGADDASAGDEETKQDA